MTDQRPGTPDTPAAGHAALQQAGATPLEPGDPPRIGPYVPLGRLGSGGMGRVYLALPADGNGVGNGVGDGAGLAAVKVIRPEYAEDAEFRRRFEREAAVHARVHTPHTPRLLGTGFDDSLLWMATQYVPGLNLADAVKSCGPLTADGMWRLVGELGRALSALAAAGVVHRDLKPSNVILSLRGAHVIDFGISQAADSSAITTTGNRVGTPAFMSPEYLREGRCDTASDVFSLAGTLVYAATGTAPFGDGTGVDVMHRVAFEEPKANVMADLALVDEALAALLSACLAKDPAGRPTPRQLTDAADEHGPASTWQEPLHARLVDRRQGCEALERTSVQQPPDPVRTPTERVAAPAPAPGFGPPTPPGAYGAPGAYGPPTPPGGYGASTPPGQYSGGATPPAQYGAPPQGGDPNRPRRKRKPYLAVVAGVAVCAVAVGAFLFTRSSGDDTASAAPTTATSVTPDNARTSPRPGSTPSPSEKQQQKADEEKGKERSGGADAAREDEEENGDTSPTPAPVPTPAATSGGRDDTPAPKPTRTATEPATPPWISQCTYYSGTELTTYGDKGQRVVQVQCMLTKRGYSVGRAGVDGQFGEDTVSAVRLFQSDKGLNVDGDVGPDTWAALRSTT